MGGKQIGIVIVCLIVIGVAVTYTVKKQTRHTGPPQHVLDEQHSYMCAKCGAGEKLALKDWQGLAEDATTKYRKCPKCGEMGFAAAVQCPHCLAMIPNAPANAEGKYACPKCGKNAMLPPGAPEMVPPEK